MCALSLIKTTHLGFDKAEIIAQLSDIIHRFNHEIGNSLTASIAVGSLIERLIDQKSVVIAQSKAISKEAWKVALITERLTSLISDKKREESEFLSTDLLNHVLNKLKNRYFIDLSFLRVKVKEFNLIGDQESLIFIICELVAYAIKSLNLEHNLISEDTREIMLEIKYEQKILNLLIYFETKHLTDIELKELTDPVSKFTDFTKNIIATIAVVKKMNGKIMIMDFLDSPKQYLGLKVELE